MQEVYQEIIQNARGVGLSMLKLCEKAQVNPSTLTRWSNGQTKSGGYETVKRLQEAIEQHKAEQNGISELGKGADQ